MDNQIKVEAKEVMDMLKGGWIVYLRGYVDEHGRKTDVTMNGLIDYPVVRARSDRRAQELAADPAFSIDICFNAWRDGQGNLHNRKAAGRTLETDIRESVPSADPDFQQAVAELHQSYTNPKQINHGFERESNSLYSNTNTDKVYLRNVLVISSVVRPGFEGNYPVKATTRVNAIKAAIERILPIGRYHYYTLEEGKYEYLSACKRQVSSSSSSEE